MQTFLPYPDFKQSLHHLDNRRLGKQRVECKQILNALTNGGGWANHPAVKMWAGYEEALKLYMNTAIQVWVQRGYKNTMPIVEVGKVVLPPWIGGPIHATHRANLLRKNPKFYGHYDWTEDPSTPYFWPV